MHDSNRKLRYQVWRQWWGPWRHTTNFLILSKRCQEWGACFRLRLIRLLPLLFFILILKVIFILLNRIPPWTATLHWTSVSSQISFRRYKSGNHRVDGLGNWIFFLNLENIRAFTKKKISNHHNWRGIGEVSRIKSQYSIIFFEWVNVREVYFFQYVVNIYIENIQNKLNLVQGYAHVYRYVNYCKKNIFL